VAEALLPKLTEKLAASGVTIYGCPRTLAIVPHIAAATDESFATEYNDLFMNIKVVDSIEEAMAHIAHYGTHHSDAIVTDDYKAAQLFIATVDSAAVYVNASTRFTDGGEFGFGGEIGISTQKLHARGPMGLEELTSSKYVLEGDGHIRS